MATGKAPRRKLRTAPANYQFDIGGGPRSSKWWDLYRDGINQSGLALFLACKHQFWLRYVCGYSQEVYNESIEFGNIFHWLIERWLKFKNPQNLEFCEGPTLAALTGEYHPKWMEGQGILSGGNKSTQELNYVRAAAMFPHYVKHYQADLKKKYRAVEKQIAVPYCCDLSGPTPSHTFPLYLTIDGVIKHGKGVKVQDTKTTSRMNPYEIQNTLRLDFQLLFYAWAWMLTGGKQVVAVEKNVIRRPITKPHKGESLKSYGKRLGKEVAKQPKYYFQRFTEGITFKELQNFSKYILSPMLRDLKEWADGGRHYPNLNSLLTKYGPCRLFTPITTANFAGVSRKRPTSRGVEI